MRNLNLYNLFALLCFWALPLQASQSDGLYEAEVEAADQGAVARTTAMGEAMAAVLLKVSGNSRILQEEVILSAMADASRYVRQYRYRSEAIPPEERQPAEGDEPVKESRLMLWVSFDSGSIDDLLRRYGFTVWSAARPTTLVWLAVEEGSQRVLVGANDEGLVREVLDAESQRRAIPIRLPLLDLTDQSQLRIVDVWGGFVDTIQRASARYEPQAVLVGKLYAAGGAWEARWMLLYQGDVHEWRHTSEDVMAVIASGVGGSSDYLSQRFAESSYMGVEQLVLHIGGIESMAAHRRVTDYLHSLHGVSAVTLRRVDATSSNFLLQVEGGSDTVLQAIAMGDRLVQVEAPLQLEQPALPEQAVEPGQPASSDEGGEGANEFQHEMAVYQQQPALMERYYRLLP